MASSFIRVHLCPSVAYGLPPSFETGEKLDTFIKEGECHGEKKGTGEQPIETVRGGISAGRRRTDETLRGHQQAGRRIGREPGRPVLVETKGRGFAVLPGCRAKRPPGSGRRPTGEEDPGTGSPGGKPGGRTRPAQPGSQFFQKCLAKSR